MNTYILACVCFLWLCKGQTVYINEVLVRPDPVQYPFVELYNPSSNPVDLNGWTISNTISNFTFITKALIPSNGYFVLTLSSLGFQFDPSGGAIILSSPSQIVHQFIYGDSLHKHSIGRFVTQDHREVFLTLQKITNGTKNSYPVVGPVVITEILYSNAGNDSYIVLKNTGIKPVKFETSLGNPWILQASIMYTLPNTTLDPGNKLIITTLDRETFRHKYIIPPLTTILTVPNFSFSSSDNILLKIPDESVSNFTTNPTYYETETVSYPKWPEDILILGNSIVRLSLMQYADDSQNWGLSSVENSCCIIQGSSRKTEATYVMPIEPNYFYNFITPMDRAMEGGYVSLLVVLTVLFSLLFVLSFRWLFLHGNPKLDQQ